MSKFKLTKNRLVCQFSRPIGANIRPKGMAIDTRNNIGVTAGAADAVYAFDQTEIRSAPSAAAHYVQTLDFVGTALARRPQGEPAMTRPDAKSTGAATPGRPVEPSHPSGTAPSGLRPDIAYTDSRQWIDEARKLGEVREASGLTWQDDIGAASEVILHDENAPCVIFDNIPGTIAGSKVLVNFFGGKRQRMTLGFPPISPSSNSAKRFAHALHGATSNGSSRATSTTGRCSRTSSPATRSTSPSFRRRNGTRRTAGAISAPAAST